MHTLKSILYLTLPSLLLCLLVAELFFRFVLPAGRMPLAYFDPDTGMMRYDTKAKRSGYRTLGKQAQFQARWHVNNVGWNSEVDYQPPDRRTKPLIAVIGDSYVAGFEVGVEHQFSTLMGNRLADDYDVYSFGLIGAPLSQYLQMSRYVQQEFEPDLVVISVVHNDFLESIYTVNGEPHYTGKPWNLKIHYTDSTLTESTLRPFVPNRITRLLEKSATVRYLAYNAGVSVGSLRQIFNTRQRPRVEIKRAVDLDVSDTMVPVIRTVTSYLVQQIKATFPEKPVVFMIDAPRAALYAGTLDTDPNARVLNNILRDACAEADVGFLDLTGPFAKAYRADGQLLDFGDVDWHWNAHANRIVADTLLAYLRTEGVLDVPYTGFSN